MIRFSCPKCLAAMMALAVMLSIGGCDSEKPVEVPTVRGAAARSKPILGSVRRVAYHFSDCLWAGKIADVNLVGYDSAADAEADGRSLCKSCMFEVDRSPETAPAPKKKQPLELPVLTLKDLESRLIDAGYFWHSGMMVEGPCVYRKQKACSRVYYLDGSSQAHYPHYGIKVYLEPPKNRPMGLVVSSSNDAEERSEKHRHSRHVGAYHRFLSKLAGRSIVRMKADEAATLPFVGWHLSKTKSVFHRDGKRITSYSWEAWCNSKDEKPEAKAP